MLEISFHKKAEKALRKFPKKHSKQIAQKIQLIRENPEQPDVKKLKGKSSDFLRADSGEYRIIFHIEENTLFIDVIGKRNDSEVYKMLENLIK